MPPIRSIASKYCACVVAVILLLSEIMPTCSRYAEKGLVCIAIANFSARQPSSCSKYTKLNTYILYNIRLILFNKYIFLIYFNSL